MCIPAWQWRVDKARLSCGEEAFVFLSTPLLQVSKKHGTKGDSQENLEF